MITSKVTVNAPSTYIWYQCLTWDSIFIFQNCDNILRTTYFGSLGGFRRAIRKQCNRDIVTKEAWCSLLCINTSICGVCSLILLQDSLACVASTCWLDHQRSHWPLQPYVTQTFTWINCSWTITSKILAQAVLLLTSDALSADSFLFSLFRLFFNSFFFIIF